MSLGEVQMSLQSFLAVAVLVLTIGLGVMVALEYVPH
jgi:hypothetical protein